MYVYKLSGFSCSSKKPENTATGFFLLLEGGEYHKEHFFRSPHGENTRMHRISEGRNVISSNYIDLAEI